jgi:hypothetical protein
MRRRTLFTVTGSLLVGAGCTTETTDGSSPTSSPGPPSSTRSATPVRDGANEILGEFYLTNGATTRHAFTVVVERLENDETLLEASYDLAGGDRKRFRNVIGTMGTY